MSVQSVAGKFIDLVGQGKHFEVMRNMYSPDMVSVEGDGRETVGKEPVIKKSEVWQGANNIHGQELKGPFFCGDPNANDGRFGVYLAIEFSPKSGGAGAAHTTHEEVALYTVKGDSITREEFYYNGHFI